MRIAIALLAVSFAGSSLATVAAADGRGEGPSRVDSGQDGVDG
jgi:hypothetical protein